MNIVIDTNIIFSALYHPSGRIGKVLLNRLSLSQFYAPTFLIQELDRHTPKLNALSKLSPDHIIFIKRIIFERIQFIDIDIITLKNREKAIELTKDIDPNDAPFIALTLELDGILWTGDKKLTNALGLKDVNWILSTPEIENLL